MIATPNIPALRLGIAAAMLGIASTVLPRFLSLNDRFPSAFLTPEAYAMALALLASGTIVGLLDPERAIRWGVVVGLGPVLDLVVDMSLQGPGNLWPIAIFLVLLIGVLPAVLGARIAQLFHRLAKAWRT